MSLEHLEKLLWLHLVESILAIVWALQAPIALTDKPNLVEHPNFMGPVGGEGMVFGKKILRTFFSSGLKFSFSGLRMSLQHLGQLLWLHLDESILALFWALQALKALNKPNLAEHPNFKGPVGGEGMVFGKKILRTFFFFRA